MSNLTEKQKEQIGAEIDNVGLGYWVLNYGTFDGDDDTLRELINKANRALTELEIYLEDNEITF